MAPNGETEIVPASIQDYVVLPLVCAAVPSFPKSATHYLYLRHNAPKVPTESTPRELFLVNVPVDATEAHFRALFADQLGGARVEHVDFEGARTGRKLTAPVAPKAGKKRKRAANGDESVDVGALPDTWDRESRRSGSTAVVTFVDATSADLGMKEAKRAVKGGKKVLWAKGVGEKTPALGAARYMAHHTMQYPSAPALQASVDAFMLAFAAKESERTKLLARQRQVPDDDGFITVTRGGRAGPARLEEAQQMAERQKEKHKGKEDFYRFQMREKQKERAGDLLRGFEDDRRKVDEMKKMRNKFRPH